VVEISKFQGDVLNNSNEFALKDVWLDDNAALERSIQQQIFEAIETEKNLFIAGEPKNRIKYLTDVRGMDSFMKDIMSHLKNGTYRELFMKIECDGSGGRTKLRAGNSHPRPGLFSSGTTTPGSGNHVLHGADRSRSSTDPTRPMSDPSSTTKRPRVDRDYLPKKRHFILYNDVGEALHHITDLQTTLGVLCDVFKGKLLLNVTTSSSD
jgi:hypothetical protein